MKQVIGFYDFAKNYMRLMDGTSERSFNDEELKEIENNLEGEVISDEWELVDSREYSEENTDLESWANSKIKQK